MTIKEIAAGQETIKEYLSRTGLVQTEVFYPLGELSSYNVIKIIYQGEPCYE